MENPPNGAQGKREPKNFRQNRNKRYQRKEYPSASSILRTEHPTLDSNQDSLADPSNVLPRHKSNSTERTKSDSHYSRNTYPNRFRRAKASSRGSFNINNHLADSNVAVYNDSGAPSAELDNSTNQIPQYHHSATSHRNQDNDFSNSTSNAQRTEQSSHCKTKLGQIVGGRYVRKHINYSNTRMQGNSSDVFPEQSSLFEKRRAKFNENQKSFSERSNDYCGNYSPRKAGMNEDCQFSVSDVYHFSSQNPSNQKSRRPTKNPSSDVMPVKENDATQRELLIQRLNKGDCECLVCCEQIRVKDQTWHCLSCFHVFHLRCIRKWARSPTSVAEGGWRCPACQIVTEKVPYDYLCFCGKSKNPEINYHLTPHSCGEVCQRPGPSNCIHSCKELCHPGPCPPCSVVMQKSCSCGKTFKLTSCSHNVEETCSSVCDKPLNCSFHTCRRKCHTGACGPCQELVAQSCFCGKTKQNVACSAETASVFHFSCGDVCGRQLKCGNHFCVEKCHPGDCKQCQLSTESVKFCPCGKTSIEMLVAYGKTLLRKSCKDPIPLCEKVCERVLSCGPKGNPHKCQSACHEGECGKCPLSTLVKCRCGACTKEFECAELSSEFLCVRRCNKRKDCGRHKCLNTCCVSVEHHCEQLCNKKLSCGNHVCQEVCHIGNCPQCWNVSFEELRCHCGESVLYPPIHCGTKPPECTNMCIREHPCNHPVRHACHSDAECPPCTSLTVKWCYGHHKQCPSVMCFLEGVSCGMQCLKELPCGAHKCQLTCHADECLKPPAKCNQPCSISRLSCGHPCGVPCHLGVCPDSPCKTEVTLTCPCGHRTEVSTCHDSSRSYHLMSVLATKMQDIKDGQSVNLNEVLGKKSKSNNRLQCNEECALIERNKRLAVALQIQNPDLSTSPGPPSYSEFLKGEARKNPSFVENVYSRISDLVQLAKESKQKCRSYSFPSMNRDQRRVVHELAEFFGCETQSYDEEPKKNVVVTAHKNKCWLPFMSIMSVVLKDMGLRKGPAPIISQPKEPSQKKKIDYFDYNE